MPKVTIFLFFISLSPVLIASRKFLVSLITWSVGVVIITAFLLSFCANIVAAIIAGAVFFGSGSIIILAGFIPTACSCSSTINLKSALVIIICGLNFSSSDAKTRCADCLNNVSFAVNWINCFG